MKKIINKLPIILILFIFQFFKSQNKERYENDYNKNVPKLQQIALSKQTFYGENFFELLSSIQSKGAKINNFSYRERGLSPKIYDVVLNFSDTDDFLIAEKKNYLRPYIIITFQEQIPDELRQLTLKYHGELTQEVKDFLANRKIEKIEFFGINGLTSKDRSER